MVIRIGLLGASKIAREAIIEPARRIEGVEVVRVAARDPLRAAAFAAAHDIAHTAPDYAALVAAADVDLVYNALPPSGHAPWSIAALDAGKHVLCEKPFSMDAEEAKRMVACAQRSGGLLIEAFHYRYHPLFARLLGIIAAGEIGAVTRIDAHARIPIPFAPGELRYDPALGGGALMDLGCYPVHWVRTIMGAEPVVTTARAAWHDTGVDVSMQLELGFDGGVHAIIDCSMAETLPAGLDAALTVVGQGGELHAQNPLVPHAGHMLTLTNAEGRREERCDGGTTFFHQLEYVVAMIREGRPAVTGGTDAVANMRVLDTARRMATARRLHPR